MSTCTNGRACGQARGCDLRLADSSEPADWPSLHHRALFQIERAILRHGGLAFYGEDSWRVAARAVDGRGHAIEVEPAGSDLARIVMNAPDSPPLGLGVRDRLGIELDALGDFAEVVCHRNELPAIAPTLHVLVAWLDGRRVVGEALDLARWFPGLVAFQDAIIEDLPTPPAGLDPAALFPRAVTPAAQVLLQQHTEGGQS